MSQTKLSKFALVLLVSAIFIGIAATPSYHRESVPYTHALNTSAMSIPNASLIFMDDSDLTDYGFQGNGSIDNPFLFDFENLTLEYSFDSDTTGIHIENITKYVIIRNLRLTNTDSTRNGTGIKILADNVVIDNVTIGNTVNGIHLEGDNLRVNYTVIDSNDYGIKAIDCTSLNVTSTNITGAKYGAFLQRCNQTLIAKNIVAGGVNGIRMYECINFIIDSNHIFQNTGKGLFIDEIPPKAGLVNLVARNAFYQNEIHAQIITDDINTIFYDEVAKEGNYWDDWKWGKYKIQTDVFDLYPLGNDLETASLFPFKLWFWIFAPILIVLGATAYFLYWKLVVQPAKQ